MGRIRRCGSLTVRDPLVGTTPGLFQLATPLVPGATRSYTVRRSRGCTLNNMVMEGDGDLSIDSLLQELENAEAQDNQVSYLQEVALSMIASATRPAAVVCRPAGVSMRWCVMEVKTYDDTSTWPFCQSILHTPFCGLRQLYLSLELLTIL